MDKIEELIGKTREYQLIESILEQHGADMEDDSDPDEGYFHLMSTSDIRDAYKEIVDSLSSSVSERNLYNVLKSKAEFDLTEYEAGFIDGWENHQWYGG